MDQYKRSKGPPKTELLGNVATDMNSVEQCLENDVIEWKMQLMSGPQSEDFAVDCFEKLADAAVLNRKSISVIFTEEFGEFIVGFLRTTPSLRSAVAVFHLLTELLSYDEGIIEYFDKSNIMELAGTMVSQDHNDLQRYSLHIYCQMLVCHQENSPIPFDIEVVCSWADMILNKLVTNTVLIEITQLLKQWIKYRDFHRHLRLILHTMWRIGNTFRNNEILGIIADAMNMLIYCDDQYFYRMYNEGLISLMNRHIADESDVKLNLPYLAPYLSMFAHALVVCSKPERVVIQLSRLGFDRIIEMMLNENRVISINAMHVIDGILLVEGDGSTTQALMRGCESMRVMAGKPDFIRIITDLVETFDDNPFDRKIAIAQLLKGLLGASNFTCYQILMEHEFFGSIKDLAAGTANINILKMLISLVHDIIFVAKMCGEVEMVKEQLNDHEVSEFVYSLMETDDPDIAYYVQKYDEIMKEIEPGEPPDQG